ncbi:MAG: hypothetical protein GY862_35520 [Gammaproteobacteria bacterium]|nr:hypothetical protein [Gammaproteobacteria bacterium]
MSEQIRLRCCHCRQVFKIPVQPIQTGPGGSLVNVTKACSHCGKYCKFVLREQQMPVANVMRGENLRQQQQALQGALLLQVFDTSPGEQDEVEFV